MSGYFPKADFGAGERHRMERVSSSLSTKAAKIRALDAAGYSRRMIAAFLGIRYQHVRNVLVVQPGGGAAPVPPPAEAPDEVPAHGRCVVDKEGRIALSGALLAALDAEAGGSVPWRFEDGELKLMNRGAGLRFAQSLVADLAKRHPETSVDDFIAERRAEAARDEAVPPHE
jgi:hypothetical protein